MRVRAARRPSAPPARCSRSSWAATRRLGRVDRERHVNGALARSRLVTSYPASRNTPSMRRLSGRVVCDERRMPLDPSDRGEVLEEQCPQAATLLRVVAPRTRPPPHPPRPSSRIGPSRRARRRARRRSRHADRDRLGSAARCHGPSEPAPARRTAGTCSPATGARTSRAPIRRRPAARAGCARSDHRPTRRRRSTLPGPGRRFLPCRRRSGSLPVPPSQTPRPSAALGSTLNIEDRVPPARGPSVPRLAVSLGSAVSPPPGG